MIWRYWLVCTFVAVLARQFNADSYKYEKYISLLQLFHYRCIQIMCTGNLVWLLKKNPITKVIFIKGKSISAKRNSTWFWSTPFLHVRREKWNKFIFTGFFPSFLFLTNFLKDNEIARSKKFSVHDRDLRYTLR